MRQQSLPGPEAAKSELPFTFCPALRVGSLKFGDVDDVFNAIIPDRGFARHKGRPFD
jgi:hypothetical protein